MDERVASLRGLEYADLRERFLDEQLHEEVELESGRFCLETEAWWDSPDRPDGNLRVVVTLWPLPDPQKWITKPVVYRDFIIAPDGSFIGEHAT